MTHEFYNLSEQPGTQARGLLDNLGTHPVQNGSQSLLDGSFFQPNAHARNGLQANSLPVNGSQIASHSQLATQAVAPQTSAKPAKKSAFDRIRVLSAIDNLTTKISNTVLEKLPSAVTGNAGSPAATQPVPALAASAGMDMVHQNIESGPLPTPNTPQQVQHAPNMATPQYGGPAPIQQSENREFASVAMSPEKSAAWQYVVANISVEAPAGVLQFETAQSPAKGFRTEKLIEVLGQIENEPFRAIVEPALVEVLVLAHDPDVTHFTDDPVDLAILIEFLAHKLISRVENSLKSSITINSAKLIDGLPNEPWYWVHCDVNDRTMTAAIAISSGLQAEAERFVENCAAPQERAVSKTLRVKVGPVSLPKSEALHTGVGDVLDCGVNPNNDVNGILERSDGKYWPVLIEDNGIVVTGEMADRILPSDESEIIAGFELGTITLAHHSRKNIVPEARIPVSRLPDGAANIWFANRIHGSGKLTVINDSLCVELNQVGESE